MIPQFGLAQLQFLLQGAVWTLILSAAALTGGGCLGFLVALCRVSSSRVVRTLSAVYVQLVQGTPLLVIMFVLFFGLPGIGINVNALTAASAALIIYAGAYLGEIWRGCIQSVPKPQWEAAECLALTRTQRMMRVVLPQAIRIATPPTIGFAVQIVKNSSLASVVGLVELARAGQIVNNSILQPFVIYSIIAVVYFAICYPLSLWGQRLEQRSGYARRASTVVAAP